MTIYMCSRCGKCYMNTFSRCLHCGEPTPEAHREAVQPFSTAVPLKQKRAPLKHNRKRERAKEHERVLKWFRSSRATLKLGAEDTRALREKEEWKRCMQRIRDAEVL